MSLLPTHRFLALLAAAAPLFLLGPLPGLAADALLLAALLADAARAPRPGQVRVTRIGPARMPLGGEAEVEIVLRNQSARAVVLRVTDDVALPLARLEEDAWERSVQPGSEARVGYRVRAEERGEAVLGDVHLRVAGPLRLAWVQRRESRTDRVRVHPPVREVERFRLLGLRHRLREEGVHVVRRRGEAGAFESLREYVTGDDPRTIDWKATARRDAVMVRQFEAERSQPVVIAIDAGRLMAERLGRWARLDYALSSALLLADVAAHRGDQVGVLVFSDRVHHFRPPGRPSLAALAEALEGVEARLVESNYPAAFTYLARQLRRRSLLVLFSDVVDTGASAALIAQMARTTHRHLALAVALRNPALEAAAAAPAADEEAAFRRAAAEELLQARATALGAMRGAGVLVADASPEELSPSVINRYLEVKERGLL